MKMLVTKIKSLCQKLLGPSGKLGVGPILAFCAAIIISAAAAASPTVARYISTTPAPFNDNGVIKEYMDFTVNTVFIVNNQNELFGAVNQGYAYIQVSDSLTNPFVITQMAKDLTTDLIIDLNGAELYRHGDDAVFTIKEGVRLTITDTSESQRGCLYNPTGTVLNIEGGALTVVSGKFECGPRYSEYYTYNNNILSTKSHKRTIVDTEAHMVTFYKRDTAYETPDATFTRSYIDAPIIIAYDTLYDGKNHHHGNVYFDWEVQIGNSFKIEDDTYCYYTTNEDESYDIMFHNAYKADWYYTYYVSNEGYRYVSTPDEDDIEVTIYGYENVIERVENIDDPNNIDAPSNNFVGAIKMSGGVFDILYGDFYNYFGVNTTACIDMVGGELIIKEGQFSTRIPNADTHAHNLVDAKEDDAAAFDPFDYFNDFHWGKEDFGPSDPNYEIYKDGIRAHKGEGYGILTSGDAKISITNGNFAASNNNLIHMQSGRLDIGGGNFLKKNTNMLSDYQHNDTTIFMHDGELNIGEANYTVYGDYARMIRMIDGKLDINGASCIIHGDYSYAVYSTIPGENLTLTDIKFDMYTRNNGGRLTGIYSMKSENSEAGKVTVKTSPGDESYINIRGDGSVGIRTDGGGVYSQGCNYIIDGNNSAGIYAREGKIQIDGGKIDMIDNVNCYGIYAIGLSENTDLDINVSHAHIDVGYIDTDTPPETTFIENKACIGVFLASANPNSRVTLNNTNIYSYELGVALSGGNLTITGSNSTPNYIMTNRASAVAVSNGDLIFAEGGTYNLTSYNTTSADIVNTYEMTVPYLDYENGAYLIKNALYRNTDGVYVNGGSVTTLGNVNITHTGLINDIDSWEYYDDIKMTSYAVRVFGGEVNITRGTITAHVGGGVCCDGGDVTLGTPTSALSDITITTTGSTIDNTRWVPVYSGTNSKPDASWARYKTFTGGNAVEINGGSLVAYNGTYTAAYGDGIVLNVPEYTGVGERATVKIYDGVYTGNMTNEQGGDRSGPGACYGLKVYGPAIIDIYNGKFNGKGGGACVSGIYDYSVSGTTQNIKYNNNYKAEVYIYEGIFGSASATDGFMIYDCSKIIFGAYSAEQYAEKIAAGKKPLEMIKIESSLAPFSINWITFTPPAEPKNSDVAVYYGAYNGSFAGWNKDDRASRVLFYNKNLNIATYNDSGNYQASVQNQGNNTAVYYTAP